ncbi:MAG: hypothetical protein J6A55_01690 [Oscillospiraceae bacterium]|nr:hypothetical protein [Oscillospiraceae bacterium]
MDKQKSPIYDALDGTKIYRPRHIAAPEGETNIITDNYTANNGRVYNVSEENIIDAKVRVDENKK